MTIEEIKKALREVRRICTETKHCENCPFVEGNGYGCPFVNYNGEAEMPNKWPLDWKED